MLVSNFIVALLLTIFSYLRNNAQEEAFSAANYYNENIKSLSP